MVANNIRDGANQAAAADPKRPVVDSSYNVLVLSRFNQGPIVSTR